jgi:hypothetical protein
MVVTSAVPVRTTRGIRKPLLALLISSLAEECGVIVPMPTCPDAPMATCPDAPIHTSINRVNNKDLFMNGYV